MGTRKRTFTARCAHLPTRVWASRPRQKSYSLKIRTTNIFKPRCKCWRTLLKQAESQNRLRSRIDILITQALALSAKDSPKALAALEQARRLPNRRLLRLFVEEAKPWQSCIQVQDGNLQQYANRILARITSTDPSSFNISLELTPSASASSKCCASLHRDSPNQGITQKLLSIEHGQGAQSAHFCQTASQKPYRGRRPRPRTRLDLTEQYPKQYFWS